MHLIFESIKVLQMHRINSLKHLALLGALKRPVKISSSEFTKYTFTSSKTAARTLKQLEEEGLIKRSIIPEGQMISITDEGRIWLEREYSDYRHIFCGDEKKVELYGNVITGLGEGQYYIAQEGYRSQFEEKLEFVPYPGTLNVRLTDHSADVQKNRSLKNMIQISGFTNGQRTFGSCNCYFVEVEGIPGAVVTPERSHYPHDLLEIISPVHLRETLDLKDGDEVKITIEDRSACE
nr:winged helix-turn-helix domain-containing protein/riboflavin kinase [Methanococcoides sp. NM1]